jgi:hypothetical protein
MCLVVQQALTTHSYAHSLRELRITACFAKLRDVGFAPPATSQSPRGVVRNQRATTQRDNAVEI